MTVNEIRGCLRGLPDDHLRKLTCRLAHVENTQALSMGLIALPCSEGAGLEMIGG